LEQRSSFVTSLLLGVATGLLWAPCAGPILGLVLTGAALGGASAQTSLLLLAYAAGAATSLAGALLVGGRCSRRMKKSLGAGEWIRRGIGAGAVVRRGRHRARAGHRRAGAAVAMRAPRRWSRR
jgi:cytochrome c biogenesis protein CcdA